MRGLTLRMVPTVIRITSYNVCYTKLLRSEYPGALPLYHMDVYRLDSPDDFLNLGVEELIYGDGVCIIEWSEKVMEILPKSAIVIKLEAEEGERRTITVENWPYEELMP